MKHTGRPLGSGGKYKTRNSLTLGEIRNVCRDWSFLSNKEICSKYNISKTQLYNIRNEYNLGSKGLANIISKKQDLDDLRNVCDIYGLLRDDGLKIYIGSSINIRTRIQDHLNLLRQNKHYNNELQYDWLQHHFHFVLLDKVEERDLLAVEVGIVAKLDTSVLYNKNMTAKDRDVDYGEIWEKQIKPRIIKQPNGCWEGQMYVKKDGYCSVQHQNKLYRIHRVSYVYHYPERDFPHLVGHTCNNHKCCNPEHLEDLTCSENSRAIPATMRRSKLYPYKDQIIHMRQVENCTYGEIAEKLPIEISDTAVFNFYRKYI